MGRDDTIPEAVRAAALVNANSGVTAYLFEPELMGFTLTRRVFFDQKDRFRNGRLIRTSSVREFVVRGDYLTAVTLTDSVYVLISAAPSLFKLGIRGRDESFAVDL